MATYSIRGVHEDEGHLIHFAESMRNLPRGEAVRRLKEFNPKEGILYSATAKFGFYDDPRYYTIFDTGSQGLQDWIDEVATEEA